MAKICIADTRVRVRPSLKLLQIIEEHKDSITEMPENLSKVLNVKGFIIPTKIDMIKSLEDVKKPNIDLKLLRDVEENEINTSKNRHSKPTNVKTDENSLNEPFEYLYLSDLRWLNSWLQKQRKDKGLNLFLHNLIEECALELPRNELAERNPELEARCQRLREQQQNQEYLNMTKNVDSSLKHAPEDTLAYQVKSMNSQMIAVLQFVFSVAAGFVFGFMGLELIFGGLKFGLRLVLGIFCALVIGVAEMYFLVKKLNEEEKAISSLKKSTNPSKKLQKVTKPHQE